MSSSPTPHTDKDTGLREAVKPRMEAMYFSGQPVKNLDTGVIDPPTSLDKALEYHLPAVMRLVEAHITKAVAEAKQEAREGLWVYIQSLYSDDGDFDYVKFVVDKELKRKERNG